MQPKVFITRPIPDEALQLLSEVCRVELNGENRILDREELFQGVREAQALLCMLDDRIDDALLEQAPDLKIVANLAVGTDNIDIDACSARGIAVTNTPGVLTEATADLTFALILAVVRRIVPADRYVREGRFNGWGALLFTGGELWGKTLGIIGMGRIGQAVARRGRGFGMKILYHNRRPVEEAIARELEAEYAGLEDVIRRADILTLHLPYSPEVHHLIDRKELQMMKPTAYLINTARGAHVNEKALVEHLREGKIAGAALDVYEHEPALAPELAALDNVVLTPHIGSAALATRIKMAKTAAENIVAALQGRRPPNLLNKEIWKGVVS
ncbi:MAG: D-glycerate dehydrogenase [Dethiobacteria bacterium]